MISINNNIRGRCLITLGLFALTALSLHAMEQSHAAQDLVITSSLPIMPDTTKLILRYKGAQVGSLNYCNTKDGGRRILTMNIVRNMRGQGFGTKLMQHFVALSEYEHVSYIDLTSKKSAIPFYLSLGFQQENPDSLYMIKKLTLTPINNGDIV